MNVRELMATIGLDFDDSGFKKAEKSIKTLKGAFLGAFGVLAAAKTAIEGLTFVVAKHGEHLGAMANKLGVTTDDLQDLANAGKMAGVDLDTLGGALDGIQEKLTSASRLDKEATLAFMRAGVATHDAAGKMKPATEVIRDLADQIQKTPNAAKRMFKAQQLIGGASEEMVRLLSKGRKGIQEFSDEARGAGAVLSKDFIEQASKFNLEIRKSLVSLDGFKNAIAVKVLPYMTKAIEAFNKWWKINGQIVRSLATFGSQAIMNTFSVLVSLVSTVVNAIKKLYDWLENVHPKLGKIALGVGGVTLAFKILSALFAASPLGRAITIVTALAGAIALLADDLKVFFEGGDSEFGRIADWIGQMLGLEHGADDTRAAFKRFFDDQDEYSIAMAESDKQLREGIIAGWTALKQFVSDAIDWFGTLPEKIDKFFGIENGLSFLTDFKGLARDASASSIAGSLAGGGAVSPSSGLADLQLQGPNDNSTHNRNSSSVKAQQTNHITINLPAGSNPNDVARALEDEKQAAYAALTPDIDLPVGAQ
jgi:hypothetical protein